MLDGRAFFAAGYTPAGFPYGIDEDEMSDLDDADNTDEVDDIAEADSDGREVFLRKDQCRICGPHDEVGTETRSPAATFREPTGYGEPF